jgi:hypothetical protein
MSQVWIKHQDKRESRFQHHLLLTFGSFPLCVCDNWGSGATVESKGSIVIAAHGTIKDMDSAHGMIRLRGFGYITIVTILHPIGDTHMNLTFQLLIIGHMRANVVMFIMAGLLAYFIDYRRVKDKAEFRLEAMLVKATSVIFVVGGALVLCLYQALFWLA